MFRDHEKFWAFMFLVGAIVLLCLIAAFAGPDTIADTPLEQSLVGNRLRIIDAAVVGLIGIAGAAGQRLFQQSSENASMASALDKLADKAPPVTGEARDSLEEHPPVLPAPAAPGASLDPWRRT